MENGSPRSANDQWRMRSRPNSPTCPPIDELHEVTTEQRQRHADPNPNPLPQPRFLDGHLYQRAARNKYAYRRRRLTVDIEDGGTLLCRRDIGSTSAQSRKDIVVRAPSTSASSIRSASNSISSLSERSTAAGNNKCIGSVVVSDREILQTLSASSSGELMTVRRDRQHQHQRNRLYSADADESSNLNAEAEDDDAGDDMTAQPSLYGRSRRNASDSAFADLLADTGTDIDDVKLYLPSSVPWRLIDVENDESLFVIEIPLQSLTQDCILCSSRRDVCDASGGGSGGGSAIFSFRSNASSYSRFAPMSSTNSIDDNESQSADGISEQSKDYHHVYFWCPGGGNEKSLWLRVAGKLGRLSSSSKKRISRSLLKPMKRKTRSRWRKFSQTGIDGSDNTRQLDRMLSSRGGNFDDTLLLDSSRHNKETSGEGSGATEEEFRVCPRYCYPHRWMTRKELAHEMLAPSSTFHDLREETENVLIGGTPPGKEIGWLELEVLCCTGLPKLDRWSNTDPVVYAVMGPYAFVTDVIRDQNHPIWPRKSRRACIFPIHHAYAVCNIGVFDDDGVGYDDDFAGRVQLDLARLRPGSTYDITLPLRLSNEVYMRRGRGTIRLRFRLHWNSENAAILSYIPKQLAIASAISHRKKKEIPPPTVTLHCSDAKAFRNLAITVYGSHMPTKFNQKILRATVRQYNLYRKTLQLTIKKTAKNIRCWRTPLHSIYVLVAWMHCVWRNSVVLCLPYALGALLYLLLRNYLRYNVNKKAHRAFAPLTFEEMFVSLVIGSIGGDCSRIESLEVEMDKRATALPTSSSRTDYFNRFYALLGFSPEDFDPDGEDINMEFPLSDKKYSKLTLDQAYSERTQKKRKGGEQNETLKAATSMLDIREMRRRGDRKSKVLGIDDEDSEDDEMEWFEGLGQEDLLRELPHAMNAGREAIQKNVGEAVGDAVNVLRAAGEGMKTVVTQQPSFGSSPKALSKKKAKESNSASPSWKKASSSKGEIVDTDASMLHVSPKDSSEIPEKERIPEQDADITDGRKKPLKEDMVEIHGKLMTNTFHVFDDRVYITRNKAGKPVKSATSPTYAAMDNSKKDAEMRKMIGLAGSSNPVTARLSDYMGPILSILQLQNQLARTIYNVWTWQDPFASFWATWLLLIAIVISVTFPFRLFAFGAGIVFVGPQNLLIRILRERRGSQAKGKEEPEKPNDVKSLVLDEVKEDNISAKKAIFSVCNHLHLSKGQLPKERVTKEDFELVVPYSPFRKQRFYDWPPDPSVSRVTI